MTNLEKLMNNKTITCFGGVAKNLMTHLDENNIDYRYTKIFDGVYEISLK